MKRARLLILASTMAMVGWGTVLPYQYAYAANTRGWGSFVAAAASSLFSVGALVAAPLGGRLADRFPPVGSPWRPSWSPQPAPATSSSPARRRPSSPACSSSASGSPPPHRPSRCWCCAGSPPRTAAACSRGSSPARRSAWPWGRSPRATWSTSARWTGCGRPSPPRPWASSLSGLLLLLAGRGAPTCDALPSAGAGRAQTGSGAAIRLIFATPALRWTAVVTIALALGFYAQFESGLPAYALTVLDVSERTIGTAAAVNCVVIIVLQMAVVRWTAPPLGAVAAGRGRRHLGAVLAHPRHGVTPAGPGRHAVRHDVRHLRRRRDDVRPGAQPAHREPGPERHGRHHARGVRRDPDQRVGGRPAAGRRGPQRRARHRVHRRARR